MCLRILGVMRNVLLIPPGDTDKQVGSCVDQFVLRSFRLLQRTTGDVTVHDQLVFSVFESGFDELLIFIASKLAESDLHLRVAEIISLMLRSHVRKREEKIIFSESRLS